MRKVLVGLIAGGVLVFALAVSGLAQDSDGLVFGVKHSQAIEAGYVGYKLDSLVLLGGIETQGFGASFSDEWSWEESWYYDEWNSWSDEARDKFTIRGRLYKPKLGVKWYLFEKEVRPYLIGEIFKVFPRASIEYKGTSEETEEMISQENEELQDILKRIRWWGGNIGVGAEYFFSENFSLGAEWGFTFSRFSCEHETETSEEEPDYRYTVKEKIEAEYNPSETYAALTLNYKF